MKALIPLAFFIGSTTWAEPKAHLEEAVSEFRGSFAVHQASPSDAPSAESAVDKDKREVVELESITVTASIGRHDLEKAIRDHAEEQAKTEIERSFSWKRGGLIASKKIGTMTADLGLWPSLEQSYKSGAAGTQNILLLKVDLLHLRW